NAGRALRLVLLFPPTRSSADHPAECGASSARPDKGLAAGAHLGLCGRPPRDLDILRPANPVIYAGPANIAGAERRKHAQRMEAPPDRAQPPFDPPVLFVSGGGCFPPEPADDSA